MAQDLAGPAARVVQAVRGFAAVRNAEAGPDGGTGPEVPPALVHGDLAAAWDPALNAAHLGLWHGRDLLASITGDPGEAARAAVWIGAIGLDGFGDAISRTDSPNARNSRLGRLLRKVGSRILAAQEALDAALESVAAAVR